MVSASTDSPMTHGFILGYVLGSTATMVATLASIIVQIRSRQHAVYILFSPFGMSAQDTPSRTAFTANTLVRQGYRVKHSKREFARLCAFDACSAARCQLARANTEIQHIAASHRRNEACEIVTIVQISLYTLRLFIQTPVHYWKTLADL